MDKEGFYMSHINRTNVFIQKRKTQMSNYEIIKELIE